MNTTAKSRRGFWKGMAADWRPACIVAFPLFVLTMWYGFSRGYDDLWLYAIAMAVGTLHIGQLTVICIRRIREWQEERDR